MLLETLAGSGLQLVEGPARLRHADDRHVQPPTFHERLQCGKYFFIGEIARGAEEYQGVGLRLRHDGGGLVSKIEFGGGGLPRSDSSKTRV